MVAGFSICMTTFNGGKHLADQLSSIAAQTVRPLELVINDDGSVDATERIVTDFAATVDFPVRFRRNEVRLGFADNFMAAAARCRGELIAFCDQDDVWRSDKLAKVQAEFDENPAVVLVSHNATVFNETGDKWLFRPGGVGGTAYAPGADLVPFEFYFGFSIAVRRELLKVVEPEERPFDLAVPAARMAHDRWVCFLASVAGDVAYIDEALVEYRQHASNASSSIRAERRITAGARSVRDDFGFHVVKMHQQLVALADLSQRYADTITGDHGDRVALYRAYQAYASARMSIAGPNSRRRRLVGWWETYRPGSLPDGGSAGRREWRRRARLQDLVCALVARPYQLSAGQAKLSSMLDAQSPP